MRDPKDLSKLAPKFGEPKALKKQVRELEKHFDKTERQPIDVAQVTRKFWSILQSEPERLTTEFIRREIGKLSWGLASIYEDSRIVDDSDAINMALELIKNNYRTRYLHGLAYSFFNAYEFYGMSEGVKILKHFFRQYLRKYDGYNKTLNLWKSMSDILLAAYGHKRVAEYIIENEIGYGDITQKFNIPKESNFWNETVNVLVDVLVSKRDVLENLEPLLNFLTEDCNLKIIKHAVEKLLLYYKDENPENINQILFDFVLEHLRAPQLGNNPRWIGVDKDARMVFTRWISVIGIETFFDAIAVDRDRKEFWLQYANKIQYTHVIFGRTDKRVNHQLYRKFLRQERGAELKGGRAQDSAFIMKIDPLVIIEFSGTGNACYLYNEESVPFNLGKYQYYLNELKDPEARRKPSPRKFKLNHRGAWQPRFRSKLRWDYGITTYSENF